MNRLKFSVMLAAILSAGAHALPIDLQIGARPSGMGGAFVAVADDINALYWNPAGLSLLSSPAAGEHNWVNQDFMGVNVNYLSLAVPLEKIGVVGGSWQMTNAGLEEGDPDDPNDYRQDHWSENTYTLSAARKLWDKALIFEQTAIGINLNRYTISTADHHNVGVGFDLGFFTLFPRGIRFGVMARSLAADIKGNKITPEYRVGTGYIWKADSQHRLTVAMDLLIKQNVEYQDAGTLEPVKVNLKGCEGLEYQLTVNDWRVAVRAGSYATLRSVRSNVAVTAGLGIGFQDYMLDYAFKYDTNPTEALGMAHRISFSYRAGTVPAMAKGGGKK